MSKTECRCLRGILIRESGEVSFFDQETIQVNGNETLHSFKFCPKCGEELSYRMLMTDSKMMSLMKSSDRMRATSEAVNNKEK
jgi:hypothetical protein